MSYKYTPRKKTEVLSQKEVDKLLQGTAPKKGEKPKPKTYAEKMEELRVDRELRELCRKFKSYEKYIKEWEEIYTPEMQIDNSISLIVSRFSQKELGRLIPIDRIYDAIRTADTFTLYSYVVIDFKLPSKFYFNDDGKQYKIEIELTPLSHTVELITRGDGLVELTIPLQKTVYKIKQCVEYTKEMREGDPLKVALGGLSMTKPELIPPYILKNIHFLFNLSQESYLNAELMFKELETLSKERGEFYFGVEISNQLNELSIKSRSQTLSGYGKDRKEFVLAQSEIYESKLKAS